MKRIIATILLFTLLINFVACANNENEKNVKVGIIDSCISTNIQNSYGISELNDITGIQTDNDITHGSMILSIIYENAPKSEIYYCSVLDENCIGEIAHISDAIDWCIENNVDIISMSFATITDNEQLRKSIKKAIDNNIIIVASCINLSDKTCYPAMYEGVISVSEGFNKKAKIILKGRSVEFEINGTKLEKKQVSFLTAYVCGMISKQLSKGFTIEEILKRDNF